LGSGGKGREGSALIKIHPLRNGRGALTDGVDQAAAAHVGTPATTGRGTTAGVQDVERAAAELAERLPPALEPLARLAYNYRWSWLPGGPELFAAIDRERFELCLQNPVRLLQEASSRAPRRAAEDETLVARAHDLASQVNADLERPPAAGIDRDHPVAFLCAEYGVHVSLPIYSGGLGALAGDLLKEASDRAIPMVAVGLMYRKGYFRQRIDAAGWQHEYWIDTDPPRLPAARVTGPDGAPMTVEIPIYDATVAAHVWGVDVGRVPLFLLDTDISRNEAIERWITARLYDADPTTRLAQYVLLGIGGMRALQALGIDPGVIHLNEGHAALAPLALGSLKEGRARTVFTTHTPVPAGNDSYPSEQLKHAIARLADELPISQRELIGLGRTDPDDASEPFGVTQAALRMSRAANGVSRRHGQVSRSMWSSLWPTRTAEDVPIAHVTNGVRVPTWIGTHIRELLDRHLGPDWSGRADDERTSEAIDQIPGHELWRVRELQRAELIEFIRRRSMQDRLARGDLREYVEAAAECWVTTC
jgi:starch phosphorylase